MKDKEKIVIEGIEFTFIHYYDRLNSDDKKKAVACPKCLATEGFSISYGNYECIAHCKCGHDMTVYDG